MIFGSNPSPIVLIVMCFVLFGIPPLTAIGATYLFSKKFSVTAIFTAAMLYIPLIVYKLLNNFDSTELTVMLWECRGHLLECLYQKQIGRLLSLVG